MASTTTKTLSFNTSSGNDTKVNYSITATGTRTSNSYMQYVLKLTVSPSYSTTWLGQGYSVYLKGSIGGVSYSYLIKPESTTWSKGSSAFISNSTIGTVSNVPSTSAESSLSWSAYSDTYYYSSSSTTAAEGSGSTTVTTADLLYTNATSPTSVSVSTSTPYPGQSITLSWSGQSSGTNNPINSYRIYRSTSTSSYGSLITTITGNSSTNSASITVPTSVNTTYYYRVQALATYGNGALYNGYPFGKVTITNRKPNAPTVTVSASRVPSTGGSVKFTATATDSDGHTCKIYYQKGSTSGSWTYLGTTGSSVTLSITAQTTVYFRTYDGYEYSTSNTSKTIYMNTVPTVSLSTTVSPTTWSSYSSGENSVPLANSLTLKLTGSSTYSSISSYVWQYSVSTTSSSITSSSTWSSLGTSQTVYPSLASYVARGGWFRARGYVKDAYGDTSSYVYTSIYRLPSSGNGVTNVSETYNQNDDSYYGNNVPNNISKGSYYLSWDGLSRVDGQLPLAACTLSLIYRTKILESDSWSTAATLVSSLGTSAVSNGGSFSIDRGNYIQLGLRTSDYYENIDVYSESILTMEEMPYFDSASTLVVSNQDLHPYTNESSYQIAFTQPVIGNAGMPESDMYKITVSLISDSGTVTDITLLDKDYTYSISGDTVYLSFDYDVINDYFKSITTNLNDDFTATYAVTVFNNFNTESETALSASNFNISFIEPPVYADSISTFKIGIDYFGGSDNNTYNPNALFPVVENLSDTTDFKQINLERMINPNESYCLIFPKATDYNDDIITYEISISEHDTKPNLTKNDDYEGYNYTEYITIDVNDLYDLENGYYGCCIPTPSENSTNKFQIFRVRAVDTKSNFSKGIYSHTYLVFCRIGVPTISISSISVNDDSQVSTEISILDIGGSLFNNSLYFYGTGAITTENEYPNLERGLEYSTGNKIIPKDKNGDTTSFTNLAQIYLAFSDEGVVEKDEGTWYSTDNSSYYNSLTKSNNFNLSSEIGDGYFYLTVYYKRYSDAVGSYEESVISTKVYYPRTPTRSYRSNQFGINTKTLEEDAAFEVSGYQTKDKIYLKGVNEDTTEYEIIINLSSGTIEKAILTQSIIDCGTWDTDEI